jgi:TM2 domain-containing membrane protein YozV
VTLFPERSLDGQVPPPETFGTPRSLGRAWALSLVAPGAGQLYCGAKTRGLATLGLFFGILAFMLLSGSDMRWLGFRMAVMLYAFAGVDAYATAAEYNRRIEADAPDNPRVAAILNMTTNGFGYVYLGWKIGFGLFLALMYFWRSVGQTLPALGEALAFGMAAHAYVGARNARREVYREEPAAAGAVPSRVPSALPWTFSAIVLGGYFLLVLIVQVAIIARW